MFTRLVGMRNAAPFTVLYLAGLGSLLLTTFDAGTAERVVAVGVIIVLAGVVDAALSLAVRAAWSAVRSDR